MMIIHIYLYVCFFPSHAHTPVTPFSLAAGLARIPSPCPPRKPSDGQQMGLRCSAPAGGCISIPGQPRICGQGAGSIASLLPVADAP